MKLNNKEVVDYFIGGVDPKDRPDFCDTYFFKAFWKDTAKELTETELDQLTIENGDILNELANECLRG